MSARFLPRFVFSIFHYFSIFFFCFYSAFNRYLFETRAPFYLKREQHFCFIFQSSALVFQFNQRLPTAVLFTAFARARDKRNF